MSDDNKQDEGQVGVLREDEIDQFASFFLLAAQQPVFQERLQGILDMSEDDAKLAAAKRQALGTLLTDYGMVDTDKRYYALVKLYLDDNKMPSGVIFEKVREFAIAFGHTNIGTFN